MGTGDDDAFPDDGVNHHFANCSAVPQQHHSSARSEIVRGFGISGRLAGVVPLLRTKGREIKRERGPGVRTADQVRVDRVFGL